MHWMDMRLTRGLFWMHIVLSAWEHWAQAKSSNKQLEIDTRKSLYRLLPNPFLERLVQQEQKLVWFNVYSFPPFYSI